MSTHRLLTLLAALALSALGQPPATLQHTIPSPPTPGSGDRFGRSVAISGSLMVVGAFLDNTGAGSAGSAYVYDLSSGTPTVPVATLNNPSPAFSDQFGYSVAISGTRVVVGAPRDDTGAVDAGSAYVYDLASGTPTVPVATLNHPSPDENDFFGTSVAISGTQAVVGAVRVFPRGAAYVYDLVSGTPTVPVVTLSPVGSDFFGASMAISGARLVVGAIGDDTGASDAGSAHVYDLASGTPTVPVATLNNPDPAAGDNFGWSVAISGTRVVVGAWMDDTGTSDAGSAYVYDLASGTPTVPVVTLNNPSPATDDQFGYSVAISGTRVVVGANWDDTGGANAGSAYVYDLATGTPTVPLATLQKPSPAMSEEFGTSVAIDGLTATIGAIGALGKGAAYVFALTDTTTESPTLTAPADGATTASPIAVQYSLPEAALPGSVLVKFHDFPNNVEVFLTPDAAGHTAGEHTLNIDAASPGATAGIATATGGPIVDGTYAVILSYQDALGNPTASDFNLGVVVDTAPAVPVSTRLYTRGDTLPTAGVDPNIPTGVKWHGFGIPTVDQAGKVGFVGKWKNPAGSASSYGTGLFVDGVLRAYLGQAVPGIAGATFKLFRDPVMSNEHFALQATIEGAGVTKTNDTIVLRVQPGGALTVVAREGDEARDCQGATIKAFKGVHLSGGDLNTGPTGILYTVTLNQGTGTPAATSADDTAVLFFRGGTTTLVTREGSGADGLDVGETVKSYTLLKAVGGSPQQTRGHFYPDIVNFSAKLSSGRQALMEFTEENGVIATRLSGTAVGDGPLPMAQFKTFGPLGDSSSAFAMKATLINGVGGAASPATTGLFRTSGTPNDPWEALVTVGDTAGPGLTFKAVRDPVLQADTAEAIAFPATLDGATSADDAALYWTPADVVTLLAREGSAAPGGGVWSKFTSLAFPGGGQGPLFLASLLQGTDSVDKTNDLALYGVDSAGTLHKLLREADTVDGKVVKGFTALKTVTGSPGTAHAYNHAGVIVSRATYVDGTSGIIKTTVP